MTADDVRARFEVTDEDVEASGAAYFDGQWDILPPRSKAIYRNAVRRALTTYATRRAAHADLSDEVRELVEADREYDAAEAGLLRSADGPLTKRTARFKEAGKRRSIALAKFTHQEKP